MATFPPAIVVGLSATGLAVARALGRRGIPVIGVDSRPWEIGFKSRYVMPAPSLEAALRFAGDLAPVFVGGDPELLRLCRNPLGTGPEAWADGSAVQSLDKRAQYEACAALERELGVCLPRTWLPDRADDWHRIDVTTPVVVKPALGGASRLRPTQGKVWVCRSSAELRRVAERCAGSPGAVIVQSVIEGPEDAIDVAFLHRSRTGELGPIMTGRKLRQWPRGFGSAVRLATTDDRALAEHAGRLVAALGLTGPIAVEWKRRGRDRFLIEINARTPMFGAAAPEVICAAYAEYAGQPPAPGGQVPAGRIWAYGVRERLLGVRPSAATMDALCAPDDPRPGRWAWPYTLRVALTTRVGRRHPAEAAC